MSCAARTWAGPYSALSGRSANVSKKASSAATSFAAFVSAILLETCQRIKHDVITLIARTMYIKYKRTSGDSSTSLSAPLNAVDAWHSRNLDRFSMISLLSCRAASRSTYFMNESFANPGPATTTHLTCVYTKQQNTSSVELPIRRK